MFAPLKDVLKIYGDEKVPSLGFKHTGEFELITRNPDGSVDSHIRQPNAATEALRYSWFKSNNNYAGSFINGSQIIIWENSNALNPWWWADRVFVPGTYNAGASYSYTPSTRTWLIQCTFGAGTTRTFQTVGWCLNPHTGFFGNGRAFWTLHAATVLSQPVTQTSVQTLEVNYRITYQR